MWKDFHNVGLIQKGTKKGKKGKATLTERDDDDVMEASSIPHSLPQAAPISRDGIKTPADTARP